MTRVARQVGVSVSTVSRVVAGKRDIGEDTRARVWTALDDHGYARPRATREASRVAAVFRDLLSPYTLEVARGLVEATSRLGLELVLGTTSDRSVNQWLRRCRSEDVLGMVLVIALLSEADQQFVHQEGMRVVLIDPLNEPLPGVPVVGATDWHGAHDATKHLLDLGHRRIAIVIGRPHSPSGAARLAGYHDALNSADLVMDAALQRTGDYCFEGGLSSGLSLLQLDQPPTAVFATNDAQALGLLEAARRCKVAVPQELSIVSFDDTAAAGTASPALTAVRQPFAAMSQLALNLITRPTQMLDPQVSRCEVPTQLIVRDSTDRVRA